MKKKIISPPARNIVKSYWPWSIKALAKELGKTDQNVSLHLRCGVKNFFKKIEYTEAINKVFKANYEVKDLFPTIK